MLIPKHTSHKSKDKTTTTIKERIIDIENAFSLLNKPHLQPQPDGRLYNCVLNTTNTNRAEVLNFKLTNQLFNRIHQRLRKSKYYLNYLFVIEYSKVLSLGKYVTKQTNIHAHIIINSNIPQEHLEKILKNRLDTGIAKYLFLEDITNRNDKDYLAHYLTKQAQSNYLLTDKHYNYKIDYRSPQPRKTLSSRL
jgi:hypothetical protein